MAMGKLLILSRSGEPFRSREEAGRLLAKELMQYRGQHPVVLGIPRGGVVVADELAQVLEGELDIILAHKLRTPGESELALGAVSEGGQLFLNDDVVRDLGIDMPAIQQEKTRQLAEIRRRAKMFRSIRPRVPLDGRLVIVTDDGIATGATTQSAIWVVRLERPKKLVLAVPVASPESLDRLSSEVDELVCLRAPASFFAVGQFYLRFEPVTDEKVLEVLKKHAAEGAET
jgi:putative phosphoribosyl transferase